MEKKAALYCPGMYCGRTLLYDGNYSECGSCPRGSRAVVTINLGTLCTPCDDSPTFYDWLYLGFMVLLALVLHWFFIDMVSMRRSFSKEVLILHFTAFVETALASIFSLLAVEPVGSFKIRSCRVEKLSDWYTLLHNPSPNYGTALHCTQEAVYPLYTLVFIFYSFALVLMLLIRPWVCRKCLPSQSKFSVYAAMYFFPILGLMHAIFGGLIYYSFPYIIVILSVVSNAAHFAIKLDQSILSLIATTVVNLRNVVILLGHWCLHAYGIIAITLLTQPAIHGSLILLVPLPALFYILTARFTDPSKLHND